MASEPESEAYTSAEPIEPTSSRPRRPRGMRTLALLPVLLAIAFLLLVFGHALLKASLPVLEGQLALDGLGAPVTVARDGLGVPTISGANRLDVARATGFVHAQERYFQMDLARRHAAGELAELVGPAVLPADRRNRLHRFRERARIVLERGSDVERRLMTAYVEGVNAGLAALDQRPFEYFVLRATPEPWLLEDSILIVYSMFFELNDERGVRESTRGLLHDVVGPKMYRFLAPLGSRWEAPIDGTVVESAPIPAPEVFDLRSQRRAAAVLSSESPSREASSAPELGPAVLGSNNWAVAGTHTADGRALLANDMHLGHSVPNIWYRASLLYPDAEAPGGQRRVTGVTLPGTPLVIVGSNGEVAWGFTNAYGDWGDLVVLEPDPDDGDRYLTPAGPRPFERHVETLSIKGGTKEELEILETIWGPVVDDDHRGRRRALRWIAHSPEAVTLELLTLEGASDVDEALATANRIGAPPQNFVAADAGGRIGWTIMGAIPRRFGLTGELPTSWASGERGWEGWLAPEEYPRIVDPESGRIWTANNRVIGGEMRDRLAHVGYPLGARAAQIRDGLFALDAADERALLDVQLDDRALFLTEWHRILLDVLDDEAVRGQRRRRELREVVEDWQGRASADSTSYRMVRAFRLFLAEQVFESLTAACKEIDGDFDYFRIFQYEAPLRRMIEERPLHLLDPQFESWDEQLLAAVDATTAYFADNESSLRDQTWGKRNTARIQHPLSRALPFLGRWLDMPADPLPGDSHMPRYQGPAEGASERLVVSPGREETGIFHMPTGQSGHPLSPHYGDGHRAWVEGQPTPFLPGDPLHTLELRPPG